MVQAEECSTEEKDCEKKELTADESLKPIIGVQEYLNDENIFAEIFFPAIAYKGAPQVRTKVKPINLTKIFKSTGKDPDLISDHELLTHILNHSKGLYASDSEQNDKAHEALIATRPHRSGRTRGQKRH